jgi:hypothetical protein
LFFEADIQFVLIGIWSVVLENVHDTLLPSNGEFTVSFNISKIFAHVGNKDQKWSSLIGGTN